MNARVLDRLLADLRARGVLSDRRPSDHELAAFIIDMYVRYPGAA